MRVSCHSSGIGVHVVSVVGACGVDYSAISTGLNTEHQTIINPASSTVQFVFRDATAAKLCEMKFQQRNKQ